MQTTVGTIRVASTHLGLVQLTPAKQGSAQFGDRSIPYGNSVRAGRTLQSGAWLALQRARPLPREQQSYLGSKGRHQSAFPSAESRTPEADPHEFAESDLTTHSLKDCRSE